MVVVGHANAHLTSRTQEQARAEQAYFAQQAENKQSVLNKIFARARQPYDGAIASFRKQQADARRGLWKARLTLNFRKVAHFKALEAWFQQREQLAELSRDQVDNALHTAPLNLSDPNNPYTSPSDFAQANTDHGYLSDAPIWSNDQSALTGGPNPPNSRTLRPYNNPGGLRRPLAMHQADLERVVPRDQNGVPVRTPDPRGPLLRLLNDGGPTADPTRAVNCLDCSLSFYETYLHGRPTVSAPRTVDTYTYGQTDVHSGEAGGPIRAEAATGSGFTHVTPPVKGMPPADAKAEIDRGFAALAQTLLQGGHGSTAIIITQWENNGAHAWNAVNHHGTLLFIDPQSGQYSDATNFAGGPGHRTLYGHTGAPNGGNAVAIHALMVDGQGNPMAVPNTPPSPYSGRTTPPPPPIAYQQQQAQLQQQANQQAVSPPPQPTPPISIQPQPPVTPPAPPVTPPAPPVTPPVNTQPPQPAPPVNMQPQPPVTPPAPPPTPPAPPVNSQPPQPAPPVSTQAPVSPQPPVETLQEAQPTVRTPAVDETLRDDASSRTEEAASPTTTQPAPNRPDLDLLSALDPDANRDPLSVLDPAPRNTASDPRIELTTDPVPDTGAEERAKADYRYATDRLRREFDESHREQMAQDLRNQAASVRLQADGLNTRIRAATDRGDLAAADRDAAVRDRMHSAADDLQDRASNVRRGGDIGDVELTGDDWERVNDGVSDLAPGPVETGDRSALTGDIGPRSVDTTRRYNQRGGLRPPLRIHQTDLERAMPRDADGNPIRHADPRDGDWFGLVNDGGPEADPTRSINCGDTVLSLYDSYMHGRPRVSAPRTFDGYHNGDPSRPIGAERGVSARIENTTGGRFEGLTDVSAMDPQDARTEVRLAESRVRSHLLELGHGSFAFVTTQDQAGRTHAIAAVNQNGTILYLDAQNRTISATAPLRTNTGRGFPSDVVRMAALVVAGQGRPGPMTTGEGPSVAADPAGSTGDGAKVVNIAFETRAEALDAAYDRAGIERGTVPDAQWEVGDDVRRRGTPYYLFSRNEGSHGTYMQFETEQGSRVIAEHLNDPTRGPHFHAGEPKIDSTRTAVNFGWDLTTALERYAPVGGKHHLDYPREES